MQGLMGSSCLFAYDLPCAQLTLGALDENKPEAEPKVWQAPCCAAQELVPVPKRKKASNSQP